MKFKNILIALIITSIFGTICNAQTQPKNQPYFRVTYEIPKMPREVYSKAAATKNLNIYKQHLQKNKQLMAQVQKQKREQENFAKQHNEITVNLLKEDRRESLRFKPSNCPKPITITLLPTQQTISKGIKALTYTPIDISRGGVSIYSKVLKVNDEIPIHIKYGNNNIKTTLKITSNNNGRVGGKFISNDEDTSNQLLYLSSILESDSGILKTKLAPIKL